MDSNSAHPISVKMKTYLFKAVLEKAYSLNKWPDESDVKAVWRAYIPALEHKGAASWGYTEKEALENLENAVDLLVAHLLELMLTPPWRRHTY